MGKNNKKRSKRSLGAIPKGLIHKNNNNNNDPGNPFEMMAGQKGNKRPKYLVHNRPNTNIRKPKSSAMALENTQRRQTQLRESLSSSKKANVFVDRRIGQYDTTMSHDDQMLARLVRERSRQSKRISKFQLDDDTDGQGQQQLSFLTHKGKKLDPNKSEAIYSDDEDDYGNLEAVDTELHFGGSGMVSKEMNAYGVGGSGNDGTGLSQIYGQRKTELDDLIIRRKIMKAERMQMKESQIETFEKMDEGFAELSQLLRYRKNEKPSIVKKTEPTKEDEEMKQWNMEMKQMMMKPKKAATDRIKTPEEIAKEEAERLHELETRRMARMNGDFEEDDFSDISVDEYRNRKNKNKNKNTTKKKKSKATEHRNPDELSDSDDDDDDEDEHEVRFTADGLKKFDKDGREVKLEEEEDDADDSDSDSDDSDDESDDDDDDDVAHPLEVGIRVKGNYRIAEQFEAQEAWYEGVLKKVHKESDGSYKYDVEYDDGDFEEDMLPENVKPIHKTPEEKTKEQDQSQKELEAKFKRNKARDKARNEIPFVFEVPTTLEALHEMIARYATTGKDASTIIERIHKANSVRLDHRNTEKMQNFYDVLLRRFIAVGDAIFESGDGGEELGRYDQLDCLVRVMYAMAQDAPECAGAVWSRRLGIFQNAHAKRLRDAAFVHDEDEDGSLITAWPSTGTFLLLRAIGLIFPVTDRRHYVVTPAMLLMGQIVTQTPITCAYDAVMGTLFSGLLIEYTKEAKRVVPEAIGFLSGVIRSFSPTPDRFALPSFEAAYNLPSIKEIRTKAERFASKNSKIPSLELTRDFITDADSGVGCATLAAALKMIQKCTENLNGAFAIPAEAEILSEVSDSILCLRPKNLPEGIRKQIACTAGVVAKVSVSTKLPLRRRGGSATIQPVVKSLAPRMEDPRRYSMSKDKGKKAVQAAIDRTRREYKREHKAISRELRIDGAFIEKERREERERKDSKARAKRQKNFAWLEGEQASMNQQVRMGGGLLKGGGMGAAKAKAASAKLGIKKGGKF